MYQSEMHKRRDPSTSGLLVVGGRKKESSRRGHVMSGGWVGLVYHPSLIEIEATTFRHDTEKLSIVALSRQSTKFAVK